jgi:drug/metabolite transporter (DMT)-like permease
MNATAIGAAAIFMWSLLALLTAMSGAVPPFQLLAMTFLIGGLCGVATWPFREGVAARLQLPWPVWLTGIGGLFLYHFLYYTALRNAPVAEASLIAYLWPVLIVLGSALLPGERLRWFHLAGAALGFTGAGLLAAPGGAALSGSLAGYLAALACAFVWSGYSILSRRMKEASTDAVAVYCLATAALGALCHVALEETIWPQATAQWLAILGLGLMPVGLAFYAWDHGVKRGNIQLLGAAAYFAPLLSTLLLVATGVAEPGARLAGAAALIAGGALLASGIWRKPPRGGPS